MKKKKIFPHRTLKSQPLSSLKEGDNRDLRIYYSSLCDFVNQKRVLDYQLKNAEFIRIYNEIVQREGLPLAQWNDF
jgi:hypothetical protein